MPRPALTQTVSAPPTTGWPPRDRPFVPVLDRSLSTATPVARAMHVLHGSSRWLVLWLLFWGPRSFQDLLRHAEGRSRTALRRELAALRRYGLVCNQWVSETDGRPQYGLTPLGQTLKPILGSLYQWGLVYAPLADQGIPGATPNTRFQPPCTCAPS